MTKAKTSYICKYDRLPEEARRLARVPRTARVLGRLKSHQFDQITTAAEAYWEAYSFCTVDGQGDCGAIADGFKTKSACRFAWRQESDPPGEFRAYQTPRAIDLLGAMAFTMYEWGNKNGTPLYEISENYEGFKTALMQRYHRAGCLVNRLEKEESPEDFEQDWKCLLAMDSHGLQHLLFSSDASEQRLRWNDITTAAFFAALWATRRATPADHKITQAWVIDPLNETNDVYKEFWNFAVDLPAKAVMPEKRIRLFTPLYDGSLRDAKGHLLRSTEYLCRSWQFMQGKAAQKAYLVEWLAILRGEQGAEKQRIAQQLEAGFIPLVEGKLPNDTGVFWMGAMEDEKQALDHEKSRHRVRLQGPFTLHRYAVANEDYELFCAAHGDHRHFGDKPSMSLGMPGTGDRCPVVQVQVSWWDAWCFAAWCGSRLPSEAEWEYASRGGIEGKPFNFGRAGDGENCSADLCNFNGNSPYGPKAKKGENRKRTIPVDALSQSQNSWGLSQMHGNVWEWCLQIYLRDSYSERSGNLHQDRVIQNITSSAGRVLRGGCWYNYAGVCRSAVRSRFRPGGRDYYFGFRLARTV